MDTDRVSAIMRNEKELELVITQLLAESVARSDISVQGAPERIKEKYGVSFIDPEKIQDSTYPPVQEPFLNDDFGWVVGFSFAIPFFICLVLGIFVVGDIRSTSDNVLFGILGAIAGTLLGLFFAFTVKNKREVKMRQQEKRGGFVVWVVTHSPQQHQQVIEIFKQNHTKKIRNKFK